MNYVLKVSSVVAEEAVFRLHDDKNYHRVLYLQSFPLASFWPNSGNCQNPPWIHCRSSISYGCCRRRGCLQSVPSRTSLV